MARVGVIGLGAMGGHMAARLHRAGHLGLIWNRTRKRALALGEELGVAVAPDPEALAAGSEVVLTCVSRDADLLEVVERLLPGLAAGTVLVDTSTVAPGTARAVAERVGARGAQALDAPVSGGVEGARAGRLVMMVGGEAEALERVRGPLSALAARIEHLGPSGSGQATKAVNQVMAAGINQAVSEALGLGRRQGLPMERVVELLAGGAAGSWLLAHRGRSMLAGDYPPGFRVALHHKDLEICRDLGEALGLPLVCVEQTLADYRELMGQGHGDEDISALFRRKA